MSLHVVVGTSHSGTATAQLLAESGDRVRILSRRGGGPEHPLVERITADASDAALLTSLAQGAATLFNCASPAYDRLPTETPALAAALLTAAERSGARYLNLSNVYGYGPVSGAMTEDLPLSPTTIKGRVRAQMWQDAITAHEQGRIRFAEVRPGDFIGPGAVSMFNLMVAPSVLAGEAVHVPADLDAAHSWGYPGDVARILVAVSRDDQAWGRAWHVPPVSDGSVREIAVRFADLTGSPVPHLVNMSPLDLHNLASSDPIMAEVPEMQYLYQRPAVLDATLTARTFDLKPTPLDDVLIETAQAMTRSA
ncbi:NAD-dependent epimerase/dehydratase family protein [Frankia sp. Mgl5]|uniref:NAD-dependent epimerase/dehydratase family protein n=1 Tax=Frankia sp. Mgl5 TaxID=2933793 RepID=UPI002010A628|nr:NAD-dependent epimerase/dehydratase family protein [Frankia sp. Mgl5]MCK9926759.1 NAD-dependent epimerase/dehydratase family protein [Frankia sp. Mgl5]